MQMERCEPPQAGQHILQLGCRRTRGLATSLLSGTKCSGFRLECLRVQTLLEKPGRAFRFQESRIQI